MQIDYKNIFKNAPVRYHCHRILSELAENLAKVRIFGLLKQRVSYITINFTNKQTKINY